MWKPTLQKIYCFQGCTEYGSELSPIWLGMIFLKVSQTILSAHIDITIMVAWVTTTTGPITQGAWLPVEEWGLVQPSVSFSLCRTPKTLFPVSPSSFSPCAQQLFLSHMPQLALSLSCPPPSSLCAPISLVFPIHSSGLHISLHASPISALVPPLTLFPSLSPCPNFSLCEGSPGFLESGSGGS